MVGEQLWLRRRCSSGEVNARGESQGARKIQQRYNRPKWRLFWTKNTNGLPIWSIKGVSCFILYALHWSVLGDRFGLSAPWETLPPELCRPLHEVVVPHRKRDSPLRRLTLHSSFNLLVWFRLLVACFTHHFCPSDIHSSISDVLFSFLDSPFDLGGVLFLPSSCFCLLIAPFCWFPCYHCSIEACWAS